MAVTSRVRTLYEDAAETIAIAPRTKVSAVSDDSGTGLDALLQEITNSVSTVNTALSKKQNTITGGASTVATSNLTASRALVSNGSGKIAVSAVTATELGYLDGVTSAIQTQINNCMKFHSGTSAPSDTSGKTVWYDTTNKVLKFYVNSAWQGMNTYQ